MSATSQKSDLYVSLVDFERGQLSSTANHQTIFTMSVEKNYKGVCQTHTGNVQCLPCFWLSVDTEIIRVEFFSVWM